MKASFLAVLLNACLLLITFHLYAADSVESVRLYALDCGQASAPDMGFLSDTGEYDGKAFSVVVPCFLVRHSKGNLLWDTGLGDKIAQAKDGVDMDGIHMAVKRTVVSQLGDLGLTPADVTYVGFSHLHFDHTGNANLFTASTWILNKAELAWALGSPAPPAVQPDSLSGSHSAKTRMIDGDLDVFGDGTVRILRTPGHTPGHQVLLLHLRRSGFVVLSGDLYHLRENRAHRRVPTFNVERADTLASMDRVEKIVKNTKARMVVQHDPRDFRALPRFPAYLD